MWIPDSKAIFPDLLATSGDYLRVWRAGEPETRLECLLNNNKNSDFCAPLTSFDWNEVDPNLLGTKHVIEMLMTNSDQAYLLFLFDQNEFDFLDFRNL